MEEFVPYEQSLQLREMGFDYRCLGIYAHLNSNRVITAARYWGPREQISNQDSINIIKAPLFQQAFRWFREEHGLDSDVYKPHHRDDYNIYIFNRATHRNLLNLTNFSEDFRVCEIELLNRLIEIVNNKLRQQ